MVSKWFMIIAGLLVLTLIGCGNEEDRTASFTFDGVTYSYLSPEDDGFQSTQPNYIVLFYPNGSADTSANLFLQVPLSVPGVYSCNTSSTKIQFTKDGLTGSVSTSDGNCYGTNTITQWGDGVVVGSFVGRLRVVDAAFAFVKYADISGTYRTTTLK